eukprot:11190896-Lingulodinium_polyedra.AAC.1
MGYIAVCSAQWPLLVSTGLYWCLQSTMIPLGVYSVLYWTLQGDSIVGSTAGTVLLSDLESTGGSIWEPTMK